MGFEGRVLVDLEGIFYLRALSICEELRGALGKTSELVVVGAGWIGCEVAASACQMGDRRGADRGGQHPLRTSPRSGGRRHLRRASTAARRGTASRTGCRCAAPVRPGDGALAGAAGRGGRWPDPMAAEGEGVLRIEPPVAGLEVVIAAADVVGRRGATSVGRTSRWRCCRRAPREPRCGAG